MSEEGHTTTEFTVITAIARLYMYINSSESN